MKHFFILWCYIMEEERLFMSMLYQKWHKDELHTLHCSSSIVRIIKLRMRWVGGLLHLLQGNGSLERVDTDGKI
jgi:hypothetical protein